MTKRVVIKLEIMKKKNMVVMNKEIIVIIMTMKRMVIPNQRVLSVQGRNLVVKQFHLSDYACLVTTSTNHSIGYMIVLTKFTNLDLTN